MSQSTTTTTTTTRKTECPIGREAFKANAKPVLLEINGQKVQATVKEFSTGSFGWHHGDKVMLQVGDQVLRCQVGLTLTVIGSKDAK